jgi:hypothetical protein
LLGRKNKKPKKEGVSMSHAGSEAERRKRGRAMFNCSMAMFEAIQSYGFAATLDVVVRISNLDPIVSDLLPFLPSIASAAMLEAFYQRPGSKNGEEPPEGPATQSELPKTLAE